MNPDRAPRFPDLPAFMRGLPIDKRGYPVPWFVPWVDGLPVFPAMDERKRALAWRERRCWICGGKIGRVQAFVIGPMCAVNRTSAEPPSHLPCARFAARNCPFLANPRMGRVGASYKGQALDLDSAPGIMLDRNPGVTLVWGTLRASKFDDGLGSYLFNIGRPHSVEWFAHGRAATGAEVLESIMTGLPALAEIAALDDDPDGAAAELARRVEAALDLVPAENTLTGFLGRAG